MINLEWHREGINKSGITAGALGCSEIQQNGSRTFTKLQSYRVCASVLNIVVFHFIRDFPEMNRILSCACTPLTA